jgi:hypothetical protein
MAMHAKMGISGGLWALVAALAGGCCAPMLHLHLPATAEAEKVEEGVPTSFPPRPRLHPVPTRPVFHPVKGGEEKAWKAAPKPAIEPKAPEPAAEIQASYEGPVDRVDDTPSVRNSKVEQSVLLKSAGTWRARRK